LIELAAEFIDNFALHLGVLLCHLLGLLLTRGPTRSTLVIGFTFFSHGKISGPDHIGRYNAEAAEVCPVPGQE